MPLYEYGCSACGALSEISHRMSDPAPTDCPKCGAPKLTKQISAAGFRLKGSGWYETDFKSGDKRNLAADAGSPAATTKAETSAAPAAAAAPAATPSSST